VDDLLALERLPDFFARRFLSLISFCFSYSSGAVDFGSQLPDISQLFDARSYTDWLIDLLIEE